MQKLIDLIKKLYTKYESIILYVFFGGLTTCVDFATYIISTRIFSANEQIATWLAWLFAVLFAFFTNRKWVFKADTIGLKSFMYQLSSFFGARLFSGIVSWLMILLFFTYLGINDIIVKVAASVIVLILNYILSKLVVFRKKEQVSK